MIADEITLLRREALSVRNCCRIFMKYLWHSVKTWLDKNVIWFNSFRKIISKEEHWLFTSSYSSCNIIIINIIIIYSVIIIFELIIIWTKKNNQIILRVYFFIQSALILQFHFVLFHNVIGCNKNVFFKILKLQSHFWICLFILKYTTFNYIAIKLNIDYKNVNLTNKFLKSLRTNYVLSIKVHV